MMELQVINEQEVLGKEFKMYGTMDEPLFLAKDVANWIGYEISNVSKMVKNVDEDEKIIARTNNTSATFLTEDGLYEVLMQSRKPIAKQFKKEVKKILKQIRQTGGYIPYSQEESDEEFLARALIVAQNTLDKKNKMIEEMKPKVNYFDTFMNSQGCYTSTQVAKLFKLSSARKLNTILNENKIIYKQGNNWLPYSTTNKEWFKVTIGEKNTHNYSQLKFTPKGIYELSKLLNITLKEEDLQEITNDK